MRGRPSGVAGLERLPDARAWIARRPGAVGDAAIGRVEPRGPVERNERAPGEVVEGRKWVCLRRGHVLDAVGREERRDVFGRGGADRAKRRRRDDDRGREPARGRLGAPRRRSYAAGAISQHLRAQRPAPPSAARPSPGRAPGSRSVETLAEVGPPPGSRASRNISDDIVNVLIGAQAENRAGRPHRRTTGPRISPPGNFLECRLKYQRPSFRSLAWVSSILATPWNGLAPGSARDRR